MTTPTEKAPLQTVHNLAEARAKKEAARRLQFLALAEVEARTSQKKSAIYAGMADGTFPKNVRLPHSRRVAWLASDVDAWIESVLQANGRAVAQSSIEGV